MIGDKRLQALQGGAVYEAASDALCACARPMATAACAIRAYRTSRHAGLETAINLEQEIRMRLYRVLIVVVQSVVVFG